MKAVALMVSVELVGVSISVVISYFKYSQVLRFIVSVVTRSHSPGARTDYMI